MYTVENENLIITIPLKTTRWNPYEAEGNANYIGAEMNNVVGIVNYPDCGFGHWIDMDYKGKEDQDTGILHDWDGSTEEFKKFCKDNKIDLIEY